MQEDNAQKPAAAVADDAAFDEMRPYEELLQETRAKKRRNVAVVFGTILVLAVGGGTYAIHASNQKAKDAVVDAWSRLSVCLTGIPVSTDSDALRRLRNTQLSMMSLDEARRSEPGQRAWPARCATYANATAEALRATGSSSPLVTGLAKLATALEAPQSHIDDLSPLVHDAWSGATSEGVQAHDVSDIPKPHVPAEPMSADSLQAEPQFLPGVIHLDRLKVEATPSGEFVFLVDDASEPKLPALCRADAAVQAIACKTLPKNLAKLSPGLEIWGTAETAGERFIFAGDRGAAGIFRARDGTEVAKGLTYGASALGDGSLARTVWSGSEAQVWYELLPPSGQVRRTKLLEYREVGNPYYNSGLFWDWLVYKAWRKNLGIQLLVRRLSKQGELGRELAVGDIGEPSLVEPNDLPHVTACRMTDALVVRVKGSDEQYTSFYVDGAWKAPVPSPGRYGVLTCANGTAVITDLSLDNNDGKYWPNVRQNRCSPASCSSVTVAFKEMLLQVPHLAPIDKSQVTAAELDGELLLLWGAGERGGLRMRSAPAQAVAKAPDRVVFDDLLDGGKYVKESTLLGTKLLSNGVHALLFLSTNRGIYAFRVGPKGSLSAVKTSFE
jgi:hypothetical protein